ncbi:MAG: hypothetical protein R6U25_07135 [Alkalispirochaeta sp.]
MQTHTRSVGFGWVTGTVISFGLALLVGAPVVAQSQAVYPGAVPAASGSESVYLADASFEEVRDFYMEAVGNPTEESGPGRRISFTYSSVAADHGTIEHTGVRVCCEGNPDAGYHQVMNQLRSNQRRGFLTAERLAEIEARYQPLGDLYYADLGDGPADAHIVTRYQRYLRTGIWMDQQEFMAMLQQLMMEGKHEEVQALQEEMEAGIEGLIELQRTAAQVDFWLECLDEIEATAPQHGFPVMIDLEYRFTTNDGRKG